ncbi:hypothetical protein [Variovorax saccharolyticus]|uniref:hypothetical protein n=1 Tax=Variovorax saccharolyticus TaxID=3053516 RepID=UPI0025771B80|nr:hypothetical protein [Variovorax sp. J31P216]MDM0026403.1 hypothetical protein [Variovorax sp. J31P216]
MSVFQGPRLLALALAMLATVPAGARPLTLFNAMRDTPITRFSTADVDLMTQTVHRTLDRGADGVAVSWENPRGTSGGSVTPGKDPEGRKHCRLARIENRHRALQNSASYIFCRSKGQPKGAWQVIGLAPTN